MTIAHSRPWIADEDIAAVTIALRTGQASMGQYVRQFETELARTAGQRFGVATSSGTAALHLALLGLGVGEGDEVVLPSYACTALLNAVSYVGAVPVVCDVDEETGNIDPADVRLRLTKRTKAVIAVHLFGHPAEMDWFDQVDIPIVEDCAQSLGATRLGRPVGSLATISVFSFYATKVISTGEGGMVCSSSPDFIERVRDLRDYDNRQTYRVRYNYKMSDLQASLGLAQLSRLSAMLARRRELASRYGSALVDLDLRLPPRRAGCEPIFYRYVIRTNQLERALYEFAAHQVECKRPVFRPLHHYLGGAAQELPRTERLHEEALSLPLYPAMDDEEADRVISAARAILARRPSGAPV